MGIINKKIISTNSLQEAWEENPEDPFHFIFRSLQGSCSGIYVRWPYSKEINLNKDYLRNLEDKLIPILKDYPLLIGHYTLTLKDGKMNIK